MLWTLIGAIILSINIQAGLNLHLYGDIGDALSSLGGSTSSLFNIYSDGLLNYSQILRIIVVFVNYVAQTEWNRTRILYNENKR